MGETMARILVDPIASSCRSFNENVRKASEAGRRLPAERSVDSDLRRIHQSLINHAVALREFVEGLELLGRGVCI